MVSRRVHYVGRRGSRVPVALRGILAPGRLAVFTWGLNPSSEGHAPGVPVTRLSLVSRPASAREARDWLTALLSGRRLTEAARHNATLLLSEVVSNAIRHAQGGTVVVAVSLSPSGLLAEVYDNSSDLPVRRAAGETGGWGLGLLDELSTRWGVEQHSDDGKTVWFEINDAELEGRPALDRVDASPLLQSERFRVNHGDDRNHRHVLHRRFPAEEVGRSLRAMSAYYACNACGHQFTLAQGAEPPGARTPCPVCGEDTREVGIRVEQAAEARAEALDATVETTERGEPRTAD